MIKIVLCRGGDKSAPRICEAANLLYGTRHDYKPYSDSIYMLDINWHSYKWADYLGKVARWLPTMAMVADYESPDQRPQMIQQINDLRDLGVDKIMVCPKFLGAVSDVPKNCIIAISVPTSYAGFMPLPSEVSGRDLHLLGGHPDQQAYIAQRLYRESSVVSVDGNVLSYKAAHGQYWNWGVWKATPKKVYSTFEIAVMSAKNITEYLNSHVEKFKAKRVTRCLYSQPLL